MMFETRDALLQLLPHRPPVLALESVEWHGDDRLRAALILRAESPFCHPGRGVPFWMCLEFLGQAVAALEGLRARRLGNPAPVGYLLGSRSLAAEQEYFPEGARLVLDVVERAKGVGGMAVFDGRVRCDDLVLECSFSVYRLD